MKRLGKVELASGRALTEPWAQERDLALRDLLEEASLALPGRPDEPSQSYQLFLAERDGRLVFDIRAEDGRALAQFHLSFRPLSEVARDYAQICESYFAAVQTMPPAQIEAIDMARRGIHNEGARILQERLEGKITIDQGTARRLFTLIFVLLHGTA